VARDIDQITTKLALEMPGICIQQLQVSHPGADDDGLWFSDIPRREERAQLESPDGNCPFLIESDFSAERLHASTIDEVVEAVKRLYSLSRAHRECSPCAAVTS
jgi:hypothetical protein